MFKNIVCPYGIKLLRKNEGGVFYITQHYRQSFFSSERNVFRNNSDPYATLPESGQEAPL